MMQHSNMVVLSEPPNDTSKKSKPSG
jgi:hypothetical protein